MKITLQNLVLLAILISYHVANGQEQVNDIDTLSANALLPMGRYYYDDHNALHLISSAAHFSVGFKGKQCSIVYALPDTNAHGYLQYELDGVYQKRIRINGNNKLPLIIAAAKNSRHLLTIYKTTEAHTGDIVINAVAAKNIYAAAPEKLPVIEFIGNSITCGAAADPSEIPCGTADYHDQHNAYMAYGPRVARALHAAFVLSSVSGIGIYRNWNSDGPTMPQVYEKTDFKDGSSRLWNFETYSPKVVSIALGTNDFSTGDGKRPRLPFDSAAFVNNYVKFIQLVKLKYPEAQIALLSSAMVNGSNRILLQNCLTAIKQQIDAVSSSNKPVALFFFEPMQARGCGGHPNVDDHRILAEQLTPFFKQLLAK
jgi:lysophospholipase L1-like esterase